MNAVDLRAEDQLLTVNGEYVIMGMIQNEILEAPTKVYNFRVADNHTYFVGKTRIGVHNAQCVLSITMTPKTVASSATSPSTSEDYLNAALGRQGLTEIPNSGPKENKFDEIWTEGNYVYEVRAHKGNAKYTYADIIYRVSRQSTINDAHGQVCGKEYLGTDGKWYHESTLRKHF